MTTTTPDPTATTPAERGYLRVATEEAYAPAEVLDLYRRIITEGGETDEGFRSLMGFYLFNDDARSRFISSRLQDAGDLRLGEMAAAGVDHMVLSLTCPGTQVRDLGMSREIATITNERIAAACRAHPDRFSGLAAVAFEDPEGAAVELERAVRELGLKGLIVNSHINGRYLSDPAFDPVLAAAERLDVPLYLHPNTPTDRMIGPLREAGLDGAIYGFAVETGMHLLKIMMSGVFDRFPRLRLVVGHLGEALPFWLYRLDYMHAAGIRAGRYEAVKPVELSITQYMQRNVWLTTSGMPWAPAIRFCRDVVGADRVMYAMDYPYQYEASEVRMQDELGLSPAEMQRFYEGIAEDVFRLDLSPLRS